MFVFQTWTFRLGQGALFESEHSQIMDYPLSLGIKCTFETINNHWESHNKQQNNQRCQGNNYQQPLGKPTTRTPGNQAAPSASAVAIAARNTCETTFSCKAVGAGKAPAISTRSRQPGVHALGQRGGQKSGGRIGRRPILYIQIVDALIFINLFIYISTATYYIIIVL